MTTPTTPDQRAEKITVKGRVPKIIEHDSGLALKRGPIMVHLIQDTVDDTMFLNIDGEWTRRPNRRDAHNPREAAEEHIAKHRDPAPPSEPKCPERKTQPCTCLGTCRGAEGLGENWHCVLEEQLQYYDACYAVRQADKQSLERDAARWRALMSCDRIRVIGSAQLGTPHAHIGVEFWGKHPDATPIGEDFLRFVDGLASPPLPPAPDPQGGELDELLTRINHVAAESLGRIFGTADKERIATLIRNWLPAPAASPPPAAAAVTGERFDAPDLAADLKLAREDCKRLEDDNRRLREANHRGGLRWNAARADNARLQSELRELDESVPKITKALADAEARAEQLAEALRACSVFVTPQERLRHWDEYKQDAARRIAALAPPAPTTDAKGAADGQ